MGWGEPQGDVVRDAERKVERAARAVARTDSPSDVKDLRDALDDLDALRRGDTLTGAGRPTFTGDGREL